MGLLSKILSRARKSKVVDEELEKSKEQNRTILDRYYNLIKSVGVINLNEIPKILGIDLQSAEKYSKILEKESKIEINYPIVGNPKIELKGLSPEKEEEIIKNKGKIKKILHPKKSKPYIKSKQAIIVGVSFLIIGFLISNLFFTLASNLSPSDSLTDALSGSNSYLCKFDRNSIEVVYFFKDNKMGIEYFGDESDTKIIYKDGKKYTKINDESWEEENSEPFNLYPPSNVECETTQIDDSDFDTN